MYQFGFIGMGNMASAIVKGMLKTGAFQGHDFIAYDVNETSLDAMAAQGVIKAQDNHDVCEHAKIIFVCVKPQVVESVLEPLKEDLKGKAIVSIVLGYDFEKYETLLDHTRHLTIMPNTPVAVNAGMILLESHHSLSDEEYQMVTDALKLVGEVEVLPSHLMGVGGALSGCGPAFIYMVIEALADGAVANGMPRASAYKLASQTVLGSGLMQRESGLHPGVLKDQVTSPAGSTIRGVMALEDAGVRAAFIAAINKACGK